MALGEMMAVANQAVFASAVIAVQNGAFEQAFFQIAADFVLLSFDAARAKPKVGQPFVA